MQNKGFTLIELLMVIAIVGLLSSIVLIQLNNTRLKAVDARIKTELSTIRRFAAIYFDTNGDYGNNTNNCNTANRIFTSDSAIANIISSIDSISGVSVECKANTNYFAVSANLLSASDPNNDNWCVDSEGNSKSIAAPITNSATSCN